MGKEFHINSLEEMCNLMCGEPEKEVKTMSTKWTDIYNSEEELLQDMLKTKSNPNTTYYHQLVKGYEYIESFKAYYQKYGHLTEKQMIQLKRLAPEIHKNVYWVQKL